MPPTRTSCESTRKAVPVLGLETSLASAGQSAVREAIVVDGLVKRYGEVEAVAGLSFRVGAGTIFGLLGRNGAGKTTTLECCIGIGKPTAGTVRVLGLDPTRRTDLVRLRPRIGVQLQATSLPDKANVRELLELYAAYYRIPSRVAEMAARVGLETKLERRMIHLSGGEKQRLALALALQHDPDVFFLDEPTAGMDAFGRRILWGEVLRLRDAGKTIVLTTHYIEEAERLSDRICIVQRGHIVAEATAAELVSRHGGAATVSLVADGFVPGAGLEQLGTWTRAGAQWKLATHAEPGLAVAEIVTHANASDAKITSLDMHRPTLEDAFIAITGEAIEETA